MGLFTTRQLLGYTEQKVKFRALFLELFFRRTVNFHTEEVMLDKITGKTPVAAYVSPVVEGKVLRHRGGETRVLRPGYVKPKHEFNYQQAVERLPGEDPSQLNDPAYRRLRIITDNLKQEEHAIVQVEEMQAVNAVLYGKYTMEGDQFEKIEVDFGRSTKNNITQGGGKEWSKQDRDTFDPTHDIDLYCDQASGLVNIAIMDGTVWRLLNGFKLFREKLDTRRGSNSQLETAVKDLGAVVSFKGYYGDLAIVVAKTSYIAEDGIEKRYLPDGMLVLGNTAADGIRCYGAIQDAQALSEGVVTGILFSLGASMVLGGVAQMLAPKARTPRTQTTDNGKQNTYFSSLDNMVAQGNVLPVLYGEMRVGSRVVSQEISTADEGDGGQVVVIGR